MEVYLDGRALDSREALHQALSALLAFPAYYGKNLDALHDTIHEMARDEARHGKAFEGLLKRYFK